MASQRFHGSKPEAGIQSGDRVAEEKEQGKRRELYVQGEGLVPHRSRPHEIRESDRQIQRERVDDGEQEEPLDTMGPAAGCNWRFSSVRIRLRARASEFRRRR